MGPEIKFCGMTRAEDVAEASNLGVEYIGVIFAGGPRHQTADGASRVLGGTTPPPKRVAVVGGQTVAEIAKLVASLSVDVVQLHSDPEPRRIQDVQDATGAETWAVVRVEGAELPASFSDIATAADAVVLDASSTSGLGGTGITLPWADLAKSLERFRGMTRIVLAGGLRPENVGEAIAAIAPDVVDVSSGVESAPGVKSHERMRAFRDAVRGIGADGSP